MAEKLVRAEEPIELTEQDYQNGLLREVDLFHSFPEADESAMVEIILKTLAIRLLDAEDERGEPMFPERRDIEIIKNLGFGPHKIAYAEVPYGPKEDVVYLTVKSRSFMSGRVRFALAYRNPRLDGLVETYIKDLHAITGGNVDTRRV